MAESRSTSTTPAPTSADTATPASEQQEAAKTQGVQLPVKLYKGDAELSVSNLQAYHQRLWDGWSTEKPKTAKSAKSS